MASSKTGTSGGRAAKTLRRAERLLRRAQVMSRRPIAVLCSREVRQAERSLQRVAELVREALRPVTRLVLRRLGRRPDERVFPRNDLDEPTLAAVRDLEIALIVARVYMEKELVAVHRQGLEDSLVDGPADALREFSRILALAPDSEDLRMLCGSIKDREPESPSRGTGRRGVRSCHPRRVQSGKTQGA